MNKRQLRKYMSDKAIDDLMSAYGSSTGSTSWTSKSLATWAVKHGLWKKPESGVIKELARKISRRARKKIFRDGSREIRKYHAWKAGEDQPTFWSPIDKITPQNMKYSINARRDKCVDGLHKAMLDAEHFNSHYNAGEPIIVEPDLTRDVNEKREPTLYDDSPPTDQD
jgi:hypothetical protein